jgi:hypothetical protein
MADPNAFEHPIPTTNRIDPARVTENEAVNWTLAAVTGIKPGQLPPPLVPGFTPLDVQRMAGFGTPARNFFDQQFLQLSDPISRGLFGSVQDPGLRDLRRYYEGSALQQQVLSHPSAQFVLGGNPYGGFQNMMNASEYLARGVLPLNEGLYQRSRFGAMEQMAGLGHTMMADIYGMRGGTASLTPNLAVTRGFRAEDPFLLGAQLAARDRFMVPDEERPGAMRRARNNQERASVVGANLDMLSAGRSVFGDMPAMDMLANVERMMGADPTSNPREFRQRLTKFAALAAAVGENAQALVEVQQQMLAGIGGGVGGGGGMGYGGRAIGGIMGTLGGTIPMTSHGASVGGWVEATALTATANVASVIAGRRVFGGDLSAGGIQDIVMGEMANQQRREASGIGKAARMVRLLESTADVSPEMVVRYEEAQRGGDRHAVGQVLRGISTELYQDPTVLGEVLRNEAVYNNYVSRLALRAGPEKVMRAQEAASGDVWNIEKGEHVERVTRDRTQRSYRAALQLFRAGGLQPSLAAADEAGYRAMQLALERGGGTLAGVGKEDRAAMAQLLDTWHTTGHLSTRQIIGKMRKSEAFRNIAGGAPLAQVAEEGFGESLSDQALVAYPLLRILPEAQEVFRSSGNIEQAKNAETEVRKLISAGRYDAAQDRVERFINTEGGFTPEARGQLGKRIGVLRERLARQVVSLPGGGTGGQNPLTDVEGDVNATRERAELARAEGAGIVPALRGTTAPPEDPLYVAKAGWQAKRGGAAYQAVREAELRTQRQSDVSQLTVKTVAEKGQEMLNKGTARGTPDGSDRPIRVTIVNDERSQPPPPIESAQLGRSKTVGGPGSGWYTLFGGD